MSTLRHDHTALAEQMADWTRRHGAPTAVVDRVRQLVLDRARGHSCLVLGTPGTDAAAAEQGAFEDCRLVGDGAVPTPLVLRGDRLWLYRDYRAEERLAKAFGARSQNLLEVDLPPALVDLYAALYPEAQATGAPLAAAVALFTRLCILTGGPGTGKTTAVVRMLALLLARDPETEIALAAPTGKAAARLQESVHGQAADLPIDVSLRERLRLPVRTVHRLLGIAPGRERPRHDRTHPIPADVVVVDEASMVDLQLMDLLVDAVRPDARLILVGDRDQLASVDAGAVLADLVAARGGTADGRSAAFGRAVGPLGLEPEIVRPMPLVDSLVELRVNYRFEARPGIATAAAALREGDAERVLAALADVAAADAQRADLSNAELVSRLDPLLDQLPRPDDPDPERWLGLLEHRFRVLAATHAGPAGVTALNELVESRLRRRGWRTDDTWYAGRPLLIDRNHEGLGLANGDLGVCLPDPDRPDRTNFWVRSAAGEPARRLAVEQLPAHRTAWAMTLHKSQGSEFDHVLVTLPPGGHPLLSRELLYTGVTRAREQVTVFADEATIRSAVESVQRRRTGLAAALRGD